MANLLDDESIGTREGPIIPMNIESYAQHRYCNKCIVRCLVIFFGVLILYSAIVSTYLLIKYDNNCRCDEIQAHNTFSTSLPTPYPSKSPSTMPTNSPEPTINPTTDPTLEPTTDPSNYPTQSLSTLKPTTDPSSYPTQSPSISPSEDVLWFGADNFVPERLVYFYFDGSNSWCTNNACSTPYYYHIVTPLYGSSGTMYRYTARGYAYGAVQALDLVYVGYTYYADEVILHKQEYDMQGNQIGMEHYLGLYGTHINKLILKFGPIDRYFDGFALYYQGYYLNASLGLQFNDYATILTVNDVTL